MQKLTTTMSAAPYMRCASLSLYMICKDRANIKNVNHQETVVHNMFSVTDLLSVRAHLEGSIWMVLKVHLSHVTEVTISMARSKKDKLTTLLDGAVDRMPDQVEALLRDEARHAGHEGLGRVHSKAQALLEVPVHHADNMTKKMKLQSRGICYHKH